MQGIAQVTIVLTTSPWYDPSELSVVSRQSLALQRSQLCLQQVIGMSCLSCLFEHAEPGSLDGR